MRKVSECKEFPYNYKTTCYIFVKNNGEVKQISTNKTSIKEIKDDLLDGKGKLYAVWPGNYSSDLFLVDDINALFLAFGILESEHIHDVEWKINQFDDGVSQYAWIDCKLNCGCSIDKIGIRQFAEDMKKQKNWTISKTKISCGSRDEYFTISGRRSTIK